MAFSPNNESVLLSDKRDLTKSTYDRSCTLTHDLHAVPVRNTKFVLFNFDFNSKILLF